MATDVQNGFKTVSKPRVVACEDLDRFATLTEEIQQEATAIALGAPTRGPLGAEPGPPEEDGWEMVQPGKRRSPKKPPARSRNHVRQAASLPICICSDQEQESPAVGLQTGQAASAPVDSTGLACTASRYLIPLASAFQTAATLAATSSLTHWQVSLDWPLTRFGFIGHCATYTGSFCVFVPVLSSPAHAIEVVLVLWDDLKLTSGLRTPTAFNGQNYFSKKVEVKFLTSTTTPT
jgi:hypothetical protein